MISEDERLDVLRYAAPGGIFLLNSPYGPAEIWEKLPKETQQGILDRNLQFYVIDAYDVARATGMGSRMLKSWLLAPQRGSRRRSPAAAAGACDSGTGWSATPALARG